jgi:hypothetical protein
VHDVFELSHDETQDECRPTQLIDLEFDIIPLQCRNGQNECSGIQTKRNTGKVLRISGQVMHVQIALNDGMYEIGIGIKDRHGKPHPLRRSE